MLKCAGCDLVDVTGTVLPLLLFTWVTLQLKFIADKKSTSPYLAHGWCWLHCAGWWQKRYGDFLSRHSVYSPFAVLGILLFVRQSTLQWNHFEQQSENIALVCTAPAQFHHWHCCTWMAKTAHHRLILHIPSRRFSEAVLITSRNCIINNNLEYIAWPLVPAHLPPWQRCTWPRLPALCRMSPCSARTLRRPSFGLDRSREN